MYSIKWCYFQWFQRPWATGAVAAAPSRTPQGSLERPSDTLAGGEGASSNNLTFFLRASDSKSIMSTLLFFYNSHTGPHILKNIFLGLLDIFPALPFIATPRACRFVVRSLQSGHSSASSQASADQPRRLRQSDPGKAASRWRWWQRQRQWRPGGRVVASAAAAAATAADDDDDQQRPAADADQVDADRLPGPSGAGRVVADVDRVEGRATSTAATTQVRQRLNTYDMNVPARYYEFTTVPKG